MDFVDLVQHDPALTWIIARVSAVHSNPPTVDLIVGDLSASQDTTVEIRTSAVLRSYVPRVGDVVHAIFHPNIGALVLGCPQTSATPGPLFVRSTHAPAEFVDGTSATLTQWVNSVNIGDWTLTGSEIEIPSTGVYQIHASITWPATNTFGVRRTIVKVDGNLLTSGTTPGISTGGVETETTAVDLISAGSKIEVLGYQNSGSPVSIALARISVIQLT